MENNKTLYEILGFSKNGYNDNGEKVSFESIERAKNRLIYGSDSVPFWLHNDINKAYSVLSNPTSRKEYDESLINNNIIYSNNGDAVQVESSSEQEEYDEAVVDLNDYILSENNHPEEKEEVETQEVQPEEKEEVETQEVQPEEKEEVETQEVQPGEVQTKKDDEYIIPIAQKEKKEPKETEENPKKEMSKAKKRILFGLSATFLGIPGMIIAYNKLYKKNGKKFKLHPNKNKKVSQIKTDEARLIEQYNNNMNKEINTLLARPNNNYNLKISKARYENQVELLKKRIELKLTEKVEGKGLLKYKLEYIALNNQLERAKNRLKEIENNIKQYESTGRSKNLLSNVLNEKLYEKAEEIKESDNKSISIKKLNVQKNCLQKARDLSVKGLKLTRGTLGRIKDFGTRTWDNVRSVKEIFTSYDELTGYIPETQEEKGSKTR